MGWDLTGDLTSARTWYKSMAHILRDLGLSCLLQRWSQGLAVEASVISNHLAANLDTWMDRTLATCPPPLHPSCDMRKTVSYLSWTLECPWFICQESWGRKFFSFFLRFKLTLLNLAVDSHSSPFQLRVCPLCGQGVQDLMHVLMHCSVTSPAVMSLFVAHGVTSFPHASFWEALHRAPLVFLRCFKALPPFAPFLGWFHG